MVDRTRQKGTSAGGQVLVAALLVVLDLLVMAWWWYAWAITGWADAYDAPNPPEAPGVVRHAVWFLAGAAVVTGGGLLALRWRVPGFTQLWVLGLGAAAFGLLALSP